jgi:hypothetical protein
MPDRLFDRNNYSSKTMENFEIISAYYVDIFYNHLYIEAKKLKANGSVSSITEGYKHTLNAFLKGLENPKLYKKSIVGIHHYFINIGFASISFAKCVDRLTKEFIPTDYFNSITVTQKMGVLRMVLNQSMKKFIKKIVDDHMVKIIDYHKEKDNVRILQDELIDCFILEREGMYQRFIAENTKTNKNETVNRLLAEKMEREIKRLVGEKYEQKKYILILKKLLIKKKSEETQNCELVSKLQAEIENLRNFQQVNNTQSTRFFSNMQHKDNYPYVVQKQHEQQQNSTAQKQIEQQQNSTTQKQPEQQQNSTTQKQPEQQQNSVDNDKEELSYDTIDDNVSFIEVNTNNIHNIIQGDSNDLQKLNDIKMDDGTCLDDFL